MTLILTVLRCPDRVAPETRRLDGGELVLGRGPGADWVLSDPSSQPQISRRHCTIAFARGAWTITDGSTNGTVLNGEPVPQGRQSRALRDGDRLRIGPYEIEMRLDEQPDAFPRQEPERGAGRDAPGEGSFGAPFGGMQGGGVDPFAASPFSQSQAEGFEHEAANPFRSGAGPADEGFAPPSIRLPDNFAEELYVPPPRAASQQDHSASQGDVFVPPVVRPMGLPANWDEESVVMPRGAARPPIAPEPPAALQQGDFAATPAAPGANLGSLPADFLGLDADSPDFSSSHLAADDALPPAARSFAAPATSPPTGGYAARSPGAELGAGLPPPMGPAQGFGAPGVGAQGTGTQGAGPQGTGMHDTGTQGLGASGIRPPAHGVPGVGTQGTGASGIGAPGIGAPGAGATGAGARGSPAQGVPRQDVGDDLLTVFMQGAGMADARPADPVAAMREAGAAFRAFVHGLREVLMARAEIKSAFRIDQTMVRSRNNNPLKFAAGDDDALAALLGTGRRTDMSASAAVEGALTDIRRHELATMAAMQEAMRDVLGRLDPARFRAAAEGGLLPAQRRAKAFDLYEAEFRTLREALSEKLDDAYGRAFASAYERVTADLRMKDSDP